jgi:hypothetical protein
MNTFTQKELQMYDQLLSGQPSSGVICMNPRDYAELQKSMEFYDLMYQRERTLGRRLGKMERRWMEAKFYNRKVAIIRVNPIPFPEEKP